jgi:hypothetical protein
MTCHNFVRREAKRERDRSLPSLAQPASRVKVTECDHDFVAMRPGAGGLPFEVISSRREQRASKVTEIREFVRKFQGFWEFRQARKRVTHMWVELKNELLARGRQFIGGGDELLIPDVKRGFDLWRETSTCLS